ncbi:MAG: energy-coupled thiamine transporter ThiT, partial [Eubacteriales bacterium]
SGFFKDRKFGMTIGYVVSVLGRYFFAFLSGYIFFGMYAPEGWNPVVYSLAYNGAYLGAEALLTIIVMNVPPVKKALDKVKVMALN